MQSTFSFYLLITVFTRAKLISKIKLETFTDVKVTKVT